MALLTAMAASAQTLAQDDMVDTCTITRPDPANFTGTALTLYSGKCRVRPLSRTGGEQSDAGSVSSDRHLCRVDIPASVVDVDFNDKVTITASVNPTMVGFVAYVSDIFTGTAVSAQRLVCDRTLR